jgi:hypothetical protein
MLEIGQFATAQELAAEEKINPSYVSRALRLTLLAPDIIEAILDGQQSGDDPPASGGAISRFLENATASHERGHSPPVVLNVILP